MAEITNVGVNISEKASLIWNVVDKLASVTYATCDENGRHANTRAYFVEELK